jgi:quercetin dioxygenase-like cupin family protein
MSYFIEPENRSSMELVPGALTRTFWGQHMLLSLVEIEAHAEVPRHVHPHEQAGVLLEGEMEMGIGDEVRVLQPGDMYIIPGNVEHYARCGDIPARALDIFSPLREEFQY